MPEGPLSKRCHLEHAAEKTQLCRYHISLLLLFQRSQIHTSRWEAAGFFLSDGSVVSVLFLAGTYFTFLVYRGGAGSQFNSIAPHGLGLPWAKCSGVRVMHCEAEEETRAKGYGEWGWTGWGKGKAWLQPEAWPECCSVWSVLHLPEPHCPQSLSSPTLAWRMPQTPPNPADFQHKWPPHCGSCSQRKAGHPGTPGQSQSRELLLPNELLLFSAAADKSN